MTSWLLLLGVLVLRHALLGVQPWLGAHPVGFPSAGVDVTCFSGSERSGPSDAAIVPKVDTPRLSSFLRAACQVCSTGDREPSAAHAVWILNSNTDCLHFRINIDRRTDITKSARRAQV